MKEIKFSRNSEEKINLLSSHELIITKQLVVDAVSNPDKIEEKGQDKKIAQKKLN